MESSVIDPYVAPHFDVSVSVAAKFNTASSPHPIRLSIPPLSRSLNLVSLVDTPHIPAKPSSATALARAGAVVDLQFAVLLVAEMRKSSIIDLKGAERIARAVDG